MDNENEPLLINSNRRPFVIRRYDIENDQNDSLLSQSIDNNHQLSADNNQSASSSSSSLGILSVVFLTVNATLGAGLLNIPYSFDNSGGIIYALIIQSIHLLLIICSLMIISFATIISNVNSLQNLVRFYCGRSWSNLCSCSIFIYSYGACITYLIVIGDQYEKIIEFYFDHDHIEWYLHRNFLVFTTSIVLILPLCISKDISFLRFASFVGFLSTFYITILVLIEFCKTRSHTNDDNTDNDAKIRLEPDHWSDIFKVLPVLTFSYQCQTSWIPTLAETKNPTKIRLFTMIFLSMFICFLSYSWTAIFGLLTFGSSHIQKDMMQNYDPTDPFVAIGMVLLIIKTIVVYPILLYCGRIVIEGLFESNVRNDQNDDDNASNVNNNQNKDRKSIRISAVIIWIITSSILAIYIPNIGIAINYLGSLANFFVFILPGLCLFQIISNDNNYEKFRNKYKFISNKIILLVISIIFISYGIGIFAYSICLSIDELWFIDNRLNDDDHDQQQHILILN